MYEIKDNQGNTFGHVFENFLEKEHCEFITKVSSPLMKEATTVEPRVNGYRTNSNCFLEYGMYEPVDILAGKIMDVVQVRIENFESLQVNRYTNGQRYKKHHDYFDPKKDSSSKHLDRGGQRTWTALIYLNDVDSGGETLFNNTGLKFKPKAGTALIWKNYENGKFFTDSMHEALPPINCEKWSANVWIREKTFNSENKLMTQKSCCGKKKELPGMGKQAFNFAKAAVKHARDGFEEASFQEYVERLMWCSSCEHQQEYRCTECGCFLNKKAQWRSEDCPLGKWPKLK